jgi:hypothetical protein
VLLLGQHEYSKHQLSRKYRFNEHTPYKRSLRRQSRSNVKRCREHNRDKKRREYRSRKLSNQQQGKPHRCHRLGQKHGKCNGRIEQATRNAEEDPDVDHEREGKDKRNVLQDLERETGVGARGSVCVRGGRGTDIGDLGTGEGEEEKHCCTDELADEGYEVWSMISMLTGMKGQRKEVGVD